jgi:hypothetical protein
MTFTYHPLAGFGHLDIIASFLIGAAIVLLIVASIMAARQLADDR